MKNIIALFIIVSLSACSIFQSTENETQNDKGNDSADEVYVFDEVSENEVDNKAEKTIEKEFVEAKPEKVNNKKEVNVFDEMVENNDNQFQSSSKKFYLQFGAFSTLKRAEIFVNDNNSKINLVLSIIFDPNSELYTVRSSAYITKPEVEQIRDDYWKKNLYKDAFIVTE